MQLLRWLFGYRWSLDLVKDEQKVMYRMKCDCPVTIAGFAMGYFASGARPAPPWTLYLRFHRGRNAIRLENPHFTQNGQDVTPVLVKAIEAIDPLWTKHVSEPVFEEMATKKRLKITEYPPGQLDLQAMYDSIGKPREANFYDIMDTAFGKAPRGRH